MYVVKRSQQNPILVPDRDHYWEAFATFNLSPIKQGKYIYGLYRAISANDHLRKPENISSIGIAKSENGEDFKDRKLFIEPDDAWDRYGCEDPRAIFFEGKYYIFYTALSNYPFTSEGIRVGVAISKDLKEINEKHLVTHFNAKAMTLFPERINGKIVVMFSYHTDRPPAKIKFAELDKISDLWDQIYWEKWQKENGEDNGIYKDKKILELRRNEFDHVEVGAVPVKTEYGWLLIYSHIQNYFHSPENLDRIFGIEAVLLDLSDPTKIIGRTEGPLLEPEESYELAGYVSNVIFPTGALLTKDILTIYYGAADTTVCSASVNVNDLIFSIHPKYKEDWYFKRFAKNPIISPKSENFWESKATFNPAAILLENKIHILYRTLSGDNTSFIGYAASENGFDITERLSEPIYKPREDFEMKKISNGNSGCEDPRLTKIGNIIYMCYTAFDSIGPPRVAISSIKEKDFLTRNWNWEKPVLITPKGFDDKDTCLFPDKFKSGYFILHRMSSEICGDYLDTLDLKRESVKKCIRLIGPRINGWDSSKVGITAPPIKTKYGWLLLYHGVSKSHNTYRVGALLLDLKDPAIVLARSTDPIFEPKEEYEKVGVVNNVVFPCGMIEKEGILYIYYGGADKVTGVATMKLDVLLKALLHGKSID